MLNLYVVIRAGSFSRHVVDMASLCEYYDLNTTILRTQSLEAGVGVDGYRGES